MGAGKGQSHRVKTAATNDGAQGEFTNPLQDVSCAVRGSKWSAWMRTTKMPNLKICDYYLGNSSLEVNKVPDWKAYNYYSGNNKSKVVKRVPTDKEKEFIVCELFRDAIDNGALNLFKKVNPDDFSFQLDPYNQRNYYSRKTLIVKYAPKGEKSVEGTAIFHDHYFDQGKLSDVGAVLYCISNAIHDAARDWDTSLYK